MRRYDIVTGILLILSIIDFAPAVPVLAEEKHQARVDVVHMPKDLTTVLGKRWEEELEKMGEEYFKTSGKSIDSSGTHSPSSPAPSGPGYGTTVAVQPPAQNIASSAATGNADPLMDSPCSQLCSSSTSSMKGLSARGMGSCFTCIRWWAVWWDDLNHPPQRHATGTVPMVDTPPQPNPNARPPTNPPVDPDFDYLDNLRNAEHPPPLDPPPLKPLPPKEDSEEGSASPGAWTPLLEQKPEVVLTPPSSAMSLNYQSSSAASQPVDPLAAITAMKGKAKESSSISGTASDASGDASDG